MKYVIKNKLVSAGGSSTVTDEKGEEFYFVKGNMASASHKKVLREKKTKKELFTIRNKIFHMVKRSALIYNENGNLCATVTRRIKLNQEYDVEGSTSKIEIIGSSFAWKFDIMVDGKCAAKINRIGRVSKADSFSLEVFNEEDTPFMIALVIAIDNITDAAKGEKK